MNVNHAAFATTTALAAATIGSTFAAVSATASTVALVAYTILAITCAGASLASISAWVATNDEATDGKTVAKYFSTMKSHAGIAIAGLYQFTAQVLVQAVIHGLAEGIGTNVRRRIAGADVTIEQR